MPESVFQRLSAALGATYQIQRELGGGGMSRVYLATDRELGRDVVIKTLPADSMSHDAIERFKREIRTAARLQHPNIVPLLAAGEADGVPFYTMPWVEGASLRDRMQRGAVPTGEAITILRDVARALAAAHAKGVVHRDIKPENVLLSSGAALVTDFGVARALTAATDDGGGFRTGTGIAVGTPAYMAPEQFAADPAVDHRVDLYAWGIVAYELLATRHPFQGAVGSALLAAHLTTTPKPVRDVIPGVPAQISAIVSQCLEKDPARRPAQADDVVRAFETTGSSATSARVVPRHWFAAAAVVLVVVAVAGTLALRRGSGTVRDQRMIAVAPFRVGGAAPDVHYLREGLGDLMTPQLHAIPGVSAPGMRVMLEQWRRAAGSVDADLPDDRALRAAGRTGAAQVVLGEIVGTAAHLTISAQLMRVSDGHTLAPAKVEGPADSAAALAARLVATLLSLREGADVQRVRSVVSANPDAIAPFLAGERAYRRGRYLEALKHFGASFEHDTTFALAALRIAVINPWLPAVALPGPWLDRAWRNRQRLSGADSTLLFAFGGTNYPAPTPSRQFAVDAVSAATRLNTAELWYVAGDHFLHRFMLSGDSTYPHKALEAFQKAEALDSSFAPALEHQASTYAMLGDTLNERRAWLRQRMLDSTGDFFVYNDAIFRATAGSVEQALAIANDHKGKEDLVLAFVSNVLASDVDLSRPVDDRRLIVGDAYRKAYERAGVVHSSDPALMLEANAYWINTGRPRPFDGASTKDSALAADVMNALAGLVWDGDTAVASRATISVARLSELKDTSYSLLKSSAHLALGLWALSRGDTSGVDRERAALRSLRAPPTAPWLTLTSSVHEKLLAAHLAVARKQPDARARLQELDSLLIDAPLNRNLVLSVGNLLVSRLWEAVGDDQRALAAVERRHMNVGAAGFASARLRARARIAERLGRRQEAIEALRRFVTIRAKAEAPYQAEVAQARATLAKLEREAAGR